MFHGGTVTGARSLRRLPHGPRGRRRGIVALFLILSRPLAAAPDSSTQPLAAAPETVGHVESGAGARHDKIFGLGGLYTPLSGFVFTYGATGFYQPRSDWQLGIAYWQGQADLVDQLNQLGEVPGVRLARAFVRANAAYSYARYFYGNTFNVLGGVGWRAARADYRFESLTSNSLAVAGRLDVESVVIPLAVGNHWTWRNGISLGCDWLMLMIPVRGTSHSETQVNTLPSGSTRVVEDAVAEAGAFLAKATTVSLFNTSILLLF